MSIDKFTVYCLVRPSYNHFQLLDGFEVDEYLVGNEVDWFHHCNEDRISIMNQNIVRAISQFIGDKWGIIKSPMVIKSWQDFVIY